MKGEPLTGAGFDPAFIPGLMPPAKPAAEAGGPEPEEEPKPKAERAPEAEADTEAVAEAEPESEAEAEPEAEAAAGDVDDDSPEPAEGPVFEAADRRARILADRTGVHLSLDEENCEFSWPEIAAVETESPRFGKRFTITVHTPDHRWYPIEIEAKSRSDFAQWESELDAVLDAYFEEA